MCRGANLGPCCERGCDEPIQCQDTCGYCPVHDPFADLDSPPNNVADDPEKRRVYDLARVTLGISRTEAAIRADERRLVELRARAVALAAAPSPEVQP